MSALISIVLFVYIEVEVIQILTGILIGGIYTLLPDIDHPVSKARKFSLVIGLIVIIGSIFMFLETQLEIFLLIATIICLLLLGLIILAKHRRFFHSIYAGILFSVPLLYLDWVIFVFAISGYLLHLVLDRF